MRPDFALYGNHDAESQITRRLVLPENVNAFSSRKPGTFQLKELGVALHGQSYRQRDIDDNLVPDYPEPIAGMFNVGVLHTGLGGMKAAHMRLCYSRMQLVQIFPREGQEMVFEAHERSFRFCC